MKDTFVSKCSTMKRQLDAYPQANQDYKLKIDVVSRRKYDGVTLELKTERAKFANFTRELACRY